MVNSKYAKAYTEVLEIISYFPQEAYNKIPSEKINFYKQNMDKNYIFRINPQIDLSEQNISAEANAIIVNLYTNYLATQEEKNKIKQILYLNQQSLEKEKREKYNLESIYAKAKKNIENNYINVSEKANNNQLIERKKSFFAKFKSFVLKMLNITKN